MPPDSPISPPKLPLFAGNDLHVTEAVRLAHTAVLPDHLRPKHVHQVGHQHKSRIMLRSLLAMTILAILAAGALYVWLVGNHDETWQKNLTILPSGGMTGTKFVGRDSSGQPFVITAKTVQMSAGSEKWVEMGQPMAEITLNDGSWVAAVADKGRYDSKASKLYLNDNVRLFHDSGYTLETSAAVVSPKSGMAEATTAVDVQGPSGSITAGRATVTNKGNIVEFLDKPRLLLTDVGSLL